MGFEAVVIQSHFFEDCDCGTAWDDVRVSFTVGGGVPMVGFVLVGFVERCPAREGWPGWPAHQAAVGLAAAQTIGQGGDGAYLPRTEPIVLDCGCAVGRFEVSPFVSLALARQN